MKKKMYILLAICLLFLFYLFFWRYLIPTDSFKRGNNQIDLEQISTISVNSSRGLAYSIKYSTIYSKNNDRYFMLIYASQNRFDHFYPHIEKQKTELTILVNQEDLNNPDLGSENRPIPVMNYKIGGEFVFDEEQYHKNIREYQAYCRWPWMKW